MSANPFVLVVESGCGGMWQKLNPGSHTCEECALCSGFVVTIFFKDTYVFLLFHCPSLRNIILALAPTNFPELQYFSTPSSRALVVTSLGGEFV